jgi:hypothetical protein
MDMHVRKIVANEAFEGKICGWCRNGLKLGEYVAICTACEQAHHGRCWEDRAGCPTVGCAHARLRRPDAGVSRAAAKTPAPGAMSSLVFGVLGFLSLMSGNMLVLVLPLLFGIAAISEARSARKAMASDPTLSRRNWATGGLVVGVIDVTLWTLGIISILCFSLLRH